MHRLGLCCAVRPKRLASAGRVARKLGLTKKRSTHRMKNHTDSRAEELIQQERAQTATAWYRRAWAQPTILLNPKLDLLAKSEREQMIENSKLEARSSSVLMAIMVAWLLICVSAWVLAPRETRNSLGLLMFLLPALGVAVLRFWGIQFAIRRNIAVHQAFEASRHGQ